MRRRNPTKTLYHSSPNAFREFKQQRRRGNYATDAGFHFGTKQTAMNRIQALAAEGRVGPGDRVYLYKVRIDFDNLVRLPENRRGTWSVTDLLRALVEESDAALPDDFVDGYYEDEIWVGDENLVDTWDDPVHQAKLFNRLMRELGIDAVVYENTYEGGGDSYIVFDPSQTTILDAEALELT
jgi:hypothetical protein